MLNQYIKLIGCVITVAVLTACGSVATKKTVSSDTDSQMSSDGIAQAISIKQDYKISAAIEQQYAYAIEAMQQENFLQAIEMFRKIADKEARASGPWINMAIAYRKLDRLEEADKAAQKAVKLNPTNPYALNQAGIIKRELGQFELAESHYKKALSEYPNYSNAHLNLAILCDLYLHKIVCAKSHYQAYQEIEKNNDKRVLAWISDLSRRESQIK